MKQSFLIILAIIFIVICIVSGTIINLQAENKEINKYNLEYEKYLNKELFGTEIATLISKVIDQNERNNIQKDENGYYINNNQNSIKIDLKMVTIEKTYPMETIYNNQITNFVQNFNQIKFKCIKIEYHEQTGKISKLIFEELE